MDRRAGSRASPCSPPGPGKVKHLVDQVGNEPGEMILRQPVVQRRGQQQDLVWVEVPERLVHGCRTTLRLLLLDRFDLEQPIATTHAETIPHE
ncbi:hypothetical protein GZL_09166 [Streptomyces sp. 769]|nr:hypothetical protein GZL_09166 [Streptomyces sp. 769]